MAEPKDTKELNKETNQESTVKATEAETKVATKDNGGRGYRPGQGRGGQDRQGQRSRRGQKPDARKSDDEFIVNTVMTRRTAKVVRGGKKLRFSALVVVGNRKGKIGFAIGKGPDPRSAVEKATKKAKRTTIMVTVIKDTIPHEVMHKVGSSRLFLKPAPEGTGIIASSVIRAVAEGAGIKNLYSKLYGTRNKVTNVQCVFDALKSMKISATKQ